MNTKTSIVYLIGLSMSATAGLAGTLSEEEQLGKSIFFDTSLSRNANQSCASCHAPEAGWTGPVSEINALGAVYEGSVPGLFGNRKPPSSAYATFSPILHLMADKHKHKAQFMGGNFWDGRATGERLGSPSAEQALGPFLNPLEQALGDNACVVYRVCAATYPVTFASLYPDACDIQWPDDSEALCAAGSSIALSADDRAKTNETYDKIGYAIAAFEGSPESSAFTSKYDYYLKGKVDLTKKEKKGLHLFKSKGMCANCHSIDRGPHGQFPLFTDFTFDNLGVPRNPDNPFYHAAEDFNPAGIDWIDLGLGGFLESRADYKAYASTNKGKQKAPTLRNVDKRISNVFVKAYAHNGYFKSLKGIVHFYNTRDIKPVCVDRFTTEAEALAQNCWPEPEYPENINTKEVGNLHLTDAQEDAIVAFLKTLTDGYSVGRR